MNFHSNIFITRIILQINWLLPNRYSKLPNVEEVRKGSIREASPQERAKFFAFARDVTGLPAVAIFLIGFISMFFGAKGEFNPVSLSCIIFAAILYVSTLKFKKRQEICESGKEMSDISKLTKLSTSALISSISIGIILGLVIYISLFLRYSQT